MFNHFRLHFAPYLALIFFFSFSGVAYASECERYERDKAEHFANIAGLKIIEKYGGGQDRRIEVYSCDYNTYSDRFSLRIGIFWNGAIFRSNRYNIDGVLTLDGDGSSTEFAETYANDNVDGLRTLALVAGGIILLGELSEQNSAGHDNSNYKVYFINECGYDIRLMLHYRDMENNWVSRGWWRIKADGEKTHLTYGGVPVESNNRYIYIYGEDFSGNVIFSGDQNVSFDGRSYPAYTLHSESIPHEITLCV